MKKVNIRQIEGKNVQLFAEDMMKVFYFRFDKGDKLPNHSHNGLGVMQIIEGSIILRFDTGEQIELDKDDIFEFNTSVIHNIEAKEDSKLILTLASYSN